MIFFSSGVRPDSEKVKALETSLYLRIEVSLNLLSV